MDDLEEVISDLSVDIAILTLPKEAALDVARRLAQTDIRGVWNFTGKELDLRSNGVVVENVHIGDSLMTLCYEMAKNENDKKNGNKI